MAILLTVICIRAYERTIDVKQGIRTKSYGGVFTFIQARKKGGVDRTTIETNFDADLNGEKKCGRNSSCLSTSFASPYYSVIYLFGLRLVYLLLLTPTITHAFSYLEL